MERNQLYTSNIIECKENNLRRGLIISGRVATISHNQRRGAQEQSKWIRARNSVHQELLGLPDSLTVWIRHWSYSVSPLCVHLFPAGVRCFSQVVLAALGFQRPAAHARCMDPGAISTPGVDRALPRKASKRWSKALRLKCGWTTDYSTVVNLFVYNIAIYLYVGRAHTHVCINVYYMLHVVLTLYSKILSM